MTALSQEIVEEVQKRSATLNRLPEIRMVAISLGYTFIELSNNRMGICFTPRSSSASCAHYPKAGSLRKKSILELTGLMLSDHPIERSVGVAAVNVLSQMIMDNEPEKYTASKTEFLDLLPIEEGRSKVGMLGNIGPFIPFLRKKASSLIVVDDNPSLKPDIFVSGYTIERDIDALKDVDVLIITGSFAAVGDFDKAIEVAKTAKFIGIVGPSAGWLPDPAFRRGVNAIAGTKIVNIDDARHAILEGGGTPHFIKYGLKYTIVR